MTEGRPPIGTDPHQAARVLASGGLVAFPTETVYGLGADARSARAVGRIFTVKGRPRSHPLIVHLGDPSWLDDWAASVPVAARRLAEAFWPGPLTMLLRRAPAVLDVVTGGRDTIGLRVPDHPLALEMLAAFGAGVAAPSANRFGRVSPTTADHVVSDLGVDVDYVLDGGACPVGVESTIVDLTTDVPEIVRTGAIGLDEVMGVVGGPARWWSGDGPARAPGMLAQHYSPRARVVVVDPHDVDRLHDLEHLLSQAVADQMALNPRTRVGVLAPTMVATGDAEVIQLEPAGEPDDYARVLYDRLRQADRLGIEVLLVVPPPPVGIGVAVRDRLSRASSTYR
ncbi:MAG: L-threonylcarbamoyladenylate synthase [Acidimicrobiales bacterium]|nr:L-threonylcarbamoyladenylate synthase [Acidimicrobiales bacterium]